MLPECRRNQSTERASIEIGRSVKMGEVRSLALYTLVVWIFASVPVALFFGRLCGLNQLSLDEDIAHVAPMETHNSPEGVVHRNAAFDADMTPV
jgi:hypothetical protein